MKLGDIAGKIRKGLQAMVPPDRGSPYAQKPKPSSPELSHPEPKQAQGPPQAVDGSGPAHFYSDDLIHWGQGGHAFYFTPEDGLVFDEEEARYHKTWFAEAMLAEPMRRYLNNGDILTGRHAKVRGWPYASIGVYQANLKYLQPVVRKLVRFLPEESVVCSARPGERIGQFAFPTTLAELSGGKERPGPRRGWQHWQKVQTSEETVR